MDQSDTPKPAAGTSPAQPPVYYDLGAILKAEPHLYFVSGIIQTSMWHLHIQLRAGAVFSFGHNLQAITVECDTAVDYCIRPSHPALLMGGPPMQYFETHPLLDSVYRGVPHTDDGEVFPSKLKFKLLIIDQSHIIAERFLLCIEKTEGTKPTPGEEAALSRGLQWMDKFRTEGPKNWW